MIEKWSILAAMRFALASIVAVNHIVGLAAPSWLRFIPMFGPFEAILGFLLISGYSIGHSYQQKPQGFLWRRIRRLYPVYLAALVLAYGANIFLSPATTPDVPTLVMNALFLNQLFTTSSYLGPAWSLSLEFWLYCIAPLLIRMSPSVARRCAMTSFGLYLAYSIAWHLMGWPYFPALGFGANLPLLSFAWIIGLQLSRTKGGESQVMRDVALMFIGHIGLTTALQVAYRLRNDALPLFFENDLLGLVMRAITLVAVWWVFQGWVVIGGQNTRRNWLFRFLGDVSYPLYLLHVPLAVLLAHWGCTSVALMYLLCLVLAAIVYWLLDTYSKRRHLAASMTVLIR